MHLTDNLNQQPDTLQKDVLVSLVLRELVDIEEGMSDMMLDKSAYTIANQIYTALVSSESIHPSNVEISDIWGIITHKEYYRRNGGEKPVREEEPLMEEPELQEEP
jgi:hypothetical protein